MRFYIQALLLLLGTFASASEELATSSEAYEISGAFAESLSKEKHDNKLAPNDPIDPSLSAECEPLTTVAGCVNVISGDFFQIEKDLIGNTIEPLSFARFYDSGNKSESFLGFGFGSHYPLWASDVEKGARHHYGLISEREGFLLLYRDKETGPSKLCFIDPRLLRKGYTNLSRAAVGGHANFVNWRALFHTTQQSPKGEWIVQLGDGTKRTYGKYVKIGENHRARMQFPTKKGYLLTKEIKPNQNKLLFSYRSMHGKPLLTQVESFNRKGAPLNKLTFHYEPEKCIIEDAYGNRVDYHYEDKPRIYAERFDVGFTKRKFLWQTESTQNGSTRYEMTPLSWKVSKIAKPGDRYLKVAYTPSGKVEALYGPSTTQDPVKRYEFSYHEGDGYTNVRDAHGQLTTYRYDDHRRLTDICTIDRGSTIRRDHFDWSAQEGQEGWLRSKSIRADGALHYLKTYRYDTRGNIIQETLYGNLTGKKPATFTLSQKTEMDAAPTYYEYTPDRRNLLKKISTSEGLTITYDYHPKTNLRTKTFYHYDGRIQERTFCTYDDNGELKSRIEDDGSGEDPDDLENATYRRITRITAVSERCAAFGKPEKIVELFLDDKGGEIPYKETHLAYDAKGCEIERKICDSTGKLGITTCKTYDGKLLLRSETNPLGHTTRYDYDDNRNKNEEELVGSGKKVKYAYDFGNRLIEKKEIHEIGHHFLTSYAYNDLDQLIEETDSYGHKTTYRYDRLGNQIAIFKPAIQDEKGNILLPTIAKTYNALNQVIEETDENGNMTQYAYTIYGAPTHITYPDDSKESYVYTPCGWLKKKIQADGTSIAYTYNAKGNLLSETYLDTAGTPVKSEEYVYKGPLLKSKKNNLGVVTTYEYDRAGRKIKETVEGLKTIHFSYDHLSRLIKKEESGRLELIAYDGLDRPVSKTLTSQGKTFAEEVYEYDMQGNQVKKVVAQSPVKSAIYTSKYHSDGTLQWEQDPLNHRTCWAYDHACQNALGQQVQERTILDALNRAAKEIEDTHHRLAARKIYDGEKLAASTEFSYDAAGHLTQELSKVMALDGAHERCLREYAVLRTYDKRGLIASETEWPDGKTTAYVYDAMKRLIKKVKPDGVELAYTYNPLGKIETLRSSDGSIHEAYVHDSHGNLTEFHDKAHGIMQIRHFDRWDRLEWEEINPGLRLSYEYDSLDRPTKMVLPDQSSVAYTYDAFHLKKAERFDPAGNCLYAVECTYDLQGNIVQKRSPAGIINTSYDLLGRTIATQSPHWEVALDQFDPVGNVLQMTQKDPNGTLHAGFTYDRLNQLKFESAFSNQFLYDSLGNCLSRNNHEHTINNLNQLTDSAETTYTYDLNGNLKRESNPPVHYVYDALNRLIGMEQENRKTKLLYDSLDRCLEMQDASGTKKLLYQGKQEIGSIKNGQLYEFRLIHPQQEHTLAIELQGKPYFPIQDAHGNIAALQKADSTLAQWTRYSAFGEQKTAGDIKLPNPWRYANRRDFSGLILFAHRLYNPRLMRWQTTDPIGFEDGLNLYHYVHNNPFAYRDPDGRFAFLIPFVVGSFGSAGIVVSAVTVGYVINTALAAGVVWGASELLYNLDQTRKYNNAIANANEVEGQPAKADGKKKPRYCGQELGNDPTKCPGEGFEWKGKGGPETGKGSWVKNHDLPTEENLHPDLYHPPPIAPHWDYNGPEGKARLYTDGIWEWK